VALRTVETECIVMIEVVKESLWLKTLAKELKVQDYVVTIYYDNNNVIEVSKNQVYHDRKKHISVKVHFMRKEIAK